MAPLRANISETESDGSFLGRLEVVFMSDIGVRESVDSLISEPSAEVVALARRRRFSASYKRRILDEVDRAGRGEIGLILRREGLYFSQLSKCATGGMG